MKKSARNVEIEHSFWGPSFAYAEKFWRIALSSWGMLRSFPKLGKSPAADPNADATADCRDSPAGAALRLRCRNEKKGQDRNSTFLLYQDALITFVARYLLAKPCYEQPSPAN